jgi:hypothetical protein
MGVPTVHFLMSVLAISNRSPNPSATIAHRAAGALTAKKFVDPREHVVHAVPTRAHQHGRCDAIAGRHAAEDEAFSM